MTRVLSLTALLSILGAAPALAQNGSTAGALELYPHYETIGARLAYTGDTDLDATARLEWRVQGTTAWTPGVAMTRITGNRWAGSVLWLTKDTGYEVRAVIDDPDGGGSVTGVTRTRVEPNLVATGATWWVAVNGNDGASGGSSAPFATLQKAMTMAQPGDQIRLRPGVYYQTAETGRAGRADALIHVIADGPGVILDGSDPAYHARSDWRDDGGGVWSVPYTGTTRIVVADSTMRLYAQGTLAALQSNANGVTQGWAADGSRLYVKLEGGASPVGRRLNVGRHNVGIYLDNDYWHVQGVELRHFGTTTGGCGIYVRYASGCVIDRNTLYSMGGKAILLRVLSANTLVEHNVIRDFRISTWPWAAVKAHIEEDAGISNRGGRGNVIRFNRVTGNFNGIDAADGTDDENIAADCDIHDNVLTEIGDDALETDTVSGINLRLYRNRIDRSYNVLSIAPVYQGPEYVLYNVMSDFRRSAFKYSYDSNGHVHIFHNTVVSSVAGAPGIWPTGRYSNQHFRNNAFSLTNGSAVASDDPGESVSGCDFDHDLFHTVGATMFRWRGVNYPDLATLRTGTGFEASGRAGDPRFVNRAGGDYSLQPGSPAIDAGVRLPGINDRYTGAAPDVGAYEVGGSILVDQLPPAAIHDLR